jgi:hypothetical protein
MGHSGPSSVGPCCVVPEKPGATGRSLHAGKRHARAAARYTEPSFGAILIDQASTAQDWDRVRRDRLQVRLRIDDIAVRPSGNGWLITIVHTRTLSREDADDLTFHAVTTVTAEPADDDRWWVTGDSSLGGTGSAAG